MSYDQDFQKSQVELLGFDGQNLQRLLGSTTATKITTVGDVIYIAIAAPGTDQATDKWQARKIDMTDADNIVISWAGSGSFNQVATDLTLLNYS